MEVRRDCWRDWKCVQALPGERRAGSPLRRVRGSPTGWMAGISQLACCGWLPAGLRHVASDHGCHAEPPGHHAVAPGHVRGNASRGPGIARCRATPRFMLESLVSSRSFRALWTMSWRPHGRASSRSSALRRSFLRGRSRTRRLAPRTWMSPISRRCAGPRLSSGSWAREPRIQ
jgi:hypothetical protein